MRKLYPPIEPYATRRLQVDDIHELYVEECGNPDGLPVLFLHGGPGAGLAPYHRQFFDPSRYRIVLFDQRGAGRSTPFAELADNSTWHIVDDIERLRRTLDVERWVVFGGSWGSTLALAYAQAHPEHVLALVLRGIFLGRPQEVRWFYEEGGASWLLPQRWAQYAGFIPEAERDQLLDAYWQRLTCDDEATRLAAARAWGAWEGGALTLEESPDTVASFTSRQVAVSLARIEAHFFRHDCFLESDQLLRNIDRIRHLPGTIVHGRYDLICPARNAADLAQAWPEAELHMVTAGHAASEPAIVDVLVRTMDRLAEQLH
ncbi:prolyl aminopeptidase [Oleiagrimonas sp. C23AA]|uniref:prolyl aminopeptidase n=1 Tax=Oleiagrimonas sp. C23AA TaxID=2719047 RepID=UPI0014201D66|nr:prolyl aminopeptidase [Oleiagrimonas sp. C23AA]NII10754.1 prolyl aminopeptidase [Oleiagrimonas sp. C23AA]